MSPIIEELFESLHDHGDEPNEVTYGQTLAVSDKQTRALVALAHLFPHRLTAAIDLIENGSCRVLTYNYRSVYVIDKFPVSLTNWSCACGDFAKQIYGLNILETPVNSQWSDVCKHILAAYIIDERFPILNYEVVLREDVSLNAIVNAMLGID